MKVGHFLVLLGVILIVVGLLVSLIGKLPFGRLPGDISYETPNVKIYFPIGTSILISIILTLILNLLIWIFRK